MQILDGLIQRLDIGHQRPAATGQPRLQPLDRAYLPYEVCRVPIRVESLQSRNGSRMGGPVANWLLVLGLFFLLPLETWSQALLLATTFAMAVSVCVFELPVINSVMYGENPDETIQRRLREIGNTSRIAGIAAGAAVWLLAI